MASGQTFSGRRKVGVLVMLMGLLTGLFATFAPLVAAEPLNPGVLGGFENEGDQDDATLNTGNIDWETVKTDPRITEWVLIHDDNDVDTQDATFLDSAKEQDPSTWGCAANESPPKDDIFRLYLASQISTAGQFLHIGYVREKAEGDTDINIEFNQASGQFSCPGDTGGRVRTRGDLMISFTFGGGADPSEINVLRWDPTAASDGPGDPDPAVTGSDFVPGDGHWDRFALAPNVAVGADNSTFGDTKGEALILDQFFNDAPLEPRAFGELTLDLGGIFGGGLLGCPGFGFVTGHSRASHSFSSDLKDIFPETKFDLSDCARIKIKKVDDSVPPVAQQGAVYGLYDSMAKAQAVVAGQADAAAKLAAVSWCSTGADGTCFLEKADPDANYWITEITPPAGLLPSTEIRAVTAAQLEPFGTLDLTGTPFVNAVPVGNVTITKRLFDDRNNNGVLDAGEQVTPDQGSDLDGISFALQQNSQPSTTHPGGLPASCTISGGTGQCTISSVKLGTYQIVETLAPNGPSGIGLGTSPSVTLTSAGVTVQATYDNPLTPLNIALDKSGPSTAVIGEVINYTFDVTTSGPPLTITSLVEVVEPPDFDDRCDLGSPLTGPTKSTDPGDDDDALLEVGEVWRWTCPHTVTVGDTTDNDGAQLQNKATVTGRDSLGRTVSATDTHTLTIDLPGVSVAKEAADIQVNAGDEVGFTITLTNDGESDATASFTDDLPGGVVWSFDGEAPDGCSLDESNDLVCDDVAVDADSTVTIDLVGTSDPADCPSISNPPFTITVPNEPEGLAGDNTTPSVPIAVDCPDVTVVKTTQTPSVTPGGAVGFDITITNGGDGVAKDVSFSDDLPNGVTWTFAGDVPQGCTLTESNNLSCSFPTLGSKQSVVVHLVGTVDAADCPGISNPVSRVSASNEASSATENNSTAIVPIAVTCPPPPPPPPPPPSPIDITIVKDGPTLAHRGDEITYDFTVTNTGDVALVTVVLTDPICDAGTITLVDDGNGDTTLAVDEVWTYECTRVITATDPDPLPNTATVRGTDVQGRTTTDDDDHLVDLIEPAIQIVKTVDDETPGVGQTVTFTYVVTNTGDTALIDVDVVDDQLGPIGTIDVLEPGQTATLTKTMVVAADSPTRNIAVADGEDVLGKTVTDDDDATITVVLGVVVTPPAVQPRTLPRTGVDADALLVASGALLLLGGLLVLSGEGGSVAVRRRRS